MAPSMPAASSKMRRSDPPAAASISPTGTSPSRCAGSEMAQPSIMLICGPWRIEQLDIVGGAQRFAAQNAQRHPRVVDIALARDQETMPGKALRGGKAALGVHDADIEKFRHLDLFDQRAGPGKRRQRALKSLRHGLVEVVERNSLRHREPHSP